MSEYLTKEEIRQWRSSLEKITLEEFAARLGKSVETNKATNDVVDIVMSKGTSSNTNKNLSDDFSAIAERAFKRERQISHTPFSISKNEMFENAQENQKMKSIINKTLNNEDQKKQNAYNQEKSLLDSFKEISAKSEVNIVLKKSLTDREQMVFEYFLNNIGKTVYAKDLAELMELPRDYVYKYIKNLRAKIVGDKLKNAPSGGFILIE